MIEVGIVTPTAGEGMAASARPASASTAAPAAPGAGSPFAALLAASTTGGDTPPALSRPMPDGVMALRPVDGDMAAALALAPLPPAQTPLPLGWPGATTAHGAGSTDVSPDTDADTDKPGPDAATAAALPLLPSLPSLPGGRAQPTAAVATATTPLPDRLPPLPAADQPAPQTAARPPAATASANARGVATAAAAPTPATDPLAPPATAMATPAVAAAPIPRVATGQPGEPPAARPATASTAAADASRTARPGDAAALATIPAPAVPPANAATPATPAAPDAGNAPAAESTAAANGTLAADIAAAPPLPAAPIAPSAPLLAAERAAPRRAEGEPPTGPAGRPAARGASGATAAPANDNDSPADPAATGKAEDAAAATGTAKPDAQPASAFARLLDGAAEAPLRDIAGHGQPVPAATVAGSHSAAASSTATGAGAAPQPAAVPLHHLAIHIAGAAQAGGHRFDIRLDPAELGRVDIRLEIAADGSTLTHLAVEKPETLDLLRSDQKQLERALQQAGLDARDGSLSFSLREDPRGRQWQQQAQNQAYASAAANSNGIETAADAAEPTRQRTRLGLRGLDISI